jgi:hypothetical protein
VNISRPKLEPKLRILIGFFLTTTGPIYRGHLQWHFYRGRLQGIFTGGFLQGPFTGGMYRGHLQGAFTGAVYRCPIGRDTFLNDTTPTSNHRILHHHRAGAGPANRTLPLLTKSVRSSLPRALPSYGSMWMFCRTYVGPKSDQNNSAQARAVKNWASCFQVLKVL